MASEGNLADRRLGDLLAGLSRRESTGVVTVQAEREIISIYLLGGEVVSADALNQSLEDGLGVLLTERGLVSHEQYAGLAAEHQSGGGRVTDLLVERRYLSRSQLLEVLRLHNLRLCSEALEWTEGQYKFYTGDEVTYEEGIVPIAIDELLARAGDATGAAAADAAAPPTSRAVFAPRPSAEEAIRDGDRLKREIAAEAPTILELVDGSRSVAEIAAEAGCSEFKASYVLSLFETEGWVERSAEAAVAAEELGRLTVGDETAALGGGDSEASSQRGRRRIRWPSFDALRQPLERQFRAWPSRVLGLAAAVAVVAAMALDPTSFLLPFAWQEDLRRAHDEDRLATAHLRLRQAADSFFLLYGRYPDDLARLVELGLIEPDDLVDPRSRPFRYSATAVSYLVRSMEGDQPLAETGMSDSIAGNFLLDPDYAMGEISDEPPLVLLD